MQEVGVGFHTDALSPMWKSASTFQFETTSKTVFSGCALKRGYWEIGCSEVA